MPYVEIIIARGVGDNGVDGGAASMSVVQYAGDELLSGNSGALMTPFGVGTGVVSV